MAVALTDTAHYSRGLDTHKIVKLPFITLLLLN